MERVCAHEPLGSETMQKNWKNITVKRQKCFLALPHCSTDFTKLHKLFISFEWVYISEWTQRCARELKRPLSV